MLGLDEGVCKHSFYLVKQEHPVQQQAHTNQRARMPSEGNEHHINAPTQVLLVALSAVGIYLYGKFLLNPANAGDRIPYFMAIAAESFILLQAVITMWTILVGGYNPRGFRFHRMQATLFPLEYRKRILDKGATPAAGIPAGTQLALNGSKVSVDVFITVYGEPLESVHNTAMAAKQIVGKHKTYILDDGKSDDVKQLAREIGVEYIRRPTNEHAKAGNINYALSKTKGDFYVILDADFVPKPNFLYETLPFMSDPDVAFVQTPQVYRNFDTIISRGAGYMQSLFYRLVMPGKNRFNAAFCVGTNVLFRRTAVESIGGMYSASNSEDIWTALSLHERGWKSIYIPDELAVGETPDSIKAYTKQQLRWATGGMEILLHHNPLFIKGLTLDQRIQYLATSMYYLLGVATALLMLLPPLQIFFNLTPVNLHTSFATWLFFYGSFYIMQIITAFYTMNGFRPETLLLATVSFPIYLRAFWNALWKKEQKWSATGNRNNVDSPYNYIIPQLLIFMFLLFTSVMGVLKYVQQQSVSLSIFWNSINVLVFGTYLVIARAEHRKLVKAAKQARKAKVSKPEIIRRNPLTVSIEVTDLLPADSWKQLAAEDTQPVDIVNPDPPQGTQEPEVAIPPLKTHKQGVLTHE